MNCPKAKRIALTLFVCIGSSVHATAYANDPVSILAKEYPALSQLYHTYPGYHKVFEDYAQQQGFRQPIEKVATVIHELIHVDSLVHQGYFVDGTYYEPYLKRSAWPSLDNETVASHLTEKEKDSRVYRQYIQSTPKNHMGNLLDELNAYTHVTPWVCRFEAGSSSDQISNMLGFMWILEGYFRTLRTKMPEAYESLRQLRVSKGAISMMMHRAWKALEQCNVEIQHMRRSEALLFLSE